MKKTVFQLMLVAAMPVMAAQNYEALVRSAESTEGGLAPISSIWQKDNAAALEAAVSPAAIAAVVADDRSAAALLGKVAPAYTTDPVAAYQIAEVTHYVMVDADRSWYEFWREDRSRERCIWVRALVKRALEAKDEYVKIFCLDQLRWCAMPGCVRCIRRIGATGTSNVRDFAAQVVREIER